MIVYGAEEEFCDNKSVFNDSSIPTLVLNQRHNTICYRRIREDQAAGVIRDTRAF